MKAFGKQPRHPELEGLKFAKQGSAQKVLLSPSELSTHSMGNLAWEKCKFEAYGRSKGWRERLKFGLRPNLGEDGNTGLKHKSYLDFPIQRFVTSWAVYTCDRTLRHWDRGAAQKRKPDQRSPQAQDAVKKCWEEALVNMPDSHRDHGVSVPCPPRKSCALGAGANWGQNNRAWTTAQPHLVMHQQASSQLLRRTALPWRTILSIFISYMIYRYLVKYYQAYFFWIGPKTISS